MEKLKNHFYFKNLVLKNEDASFKINSDGVLLAAWVYFFDEKQILEVGCGTGVISALLARRYPDKSFIAIDIDEASCLESLSNMQRNDIKNVEVECVSLQKLGNSTFNKFDHIVSNPPYFSHSTLPASISLSQSKHTTNLTFEELILHSVILLSEQGLLSVIIPSNEFDRFDTIASHYKLFLLRKCLVSGRKGKAPKRVLLNYSKLKPNEIESDEIWMYEDDNRTKSEVYQKLVSDYYL